MSEIAASHLDEGTTRAARTVEIPIQINDEVSLDLNEVAEWSGLASDTVVEIFLERTYTVFMIGFLPGFAYMGEVDDRIAMPRKNAPRTKVRPGSVAIGGRQTGVYPLESPGGWHIIGLTEMKMFDPENEVLCPLRPGDQVKFVRA
jgi:inhibitor of KinA